MIDVKPARVRVVSIAPEESFMSNFDLALSIVLGVGLAAAAGFRVFLPMLVVSVASYTGHLSLGDSFAWLGTPAALTMLGAAALAEIAAYYIPGIDNLLDALATPAAFVAGTIVSAAVMTDLPPRKHAPGRCRRILSGTRAFKRSRRSAARRAVVSRPARARDPVAVRCGVPMGRIYRYCACPAV